MKCREGAALLVVLLTCIGLSACGGLLRNEAQADLQRDASGKLVFPDTSKNWQRWRANIGVLIDAEGEKGAPQGMPSWNAFWLSIIDENKERENAPKYIDYIVTARRQAGLPELVEEGAAQ